MNTWLSLLPYWPQWLSGVYLTLQLLITSLIIGFTLALLIMACRLSPRWYLKTPAEIFVFIFRGTPLLVQIFIIYYGSGQFNWIKDSFLWNVLNSATNCAIIALALNTAAYASELFKGAVLAIPKGQLESCLALGMSQRLAFVRIILPCALRQAIPAYSNEVIMILKSTTLASTITLLDIMGMTQQVIANTYETIPCLVVAGLLYLVLNAIIVGIFRVLEQRLRVRI